MKHLRVFLILIALLLAVSSAAIFTANAGAPVGRNALLPRAYLPMVARSGAPTPAPTPTATPGPGNWTTLLEEGFETAPGPLWRFRDDNGADFGAYQWGRRACQPYTGDYSAWAVGGGADGELLPCGSAYPANAATTMIYGPFSLADAKMAQMRFRLRFDAKLPNDDFCWLASDGVMAAGRCLNAQPIGWATLDLDLGDLDPSTPGVSMLGKPQVWVGFRFTSDGAGHASEGPYVDDVVIRKCTDTTCAPIAAAGTAPGEVRVRPFRMLLNRQ